MGTWTYQYDNLGELKQQISPTESAAGVSTTLGYDVLGRLLWRSEPDMYSSWEYDLAPNGVGFVDSASCTQPAQQNGMTDACAGGSYVRTYGYESAASRPKSVTVQYGAGQAYKSSEDYDPTTALLSSVTAFSQLATTNVYNGAGYLSQIDDSGGTSIWTANSAHAEGHLTQETAGSGATPLVTNRTYYPDTGRLQGITSGTAQGDPGSSNITNLGYAWDDLGNLTGRTDTLQSFDESFCYDVLNRLTNYALQDGGGSSCTQGTIEKTMSYDGGGIGDGDITGKSDIGVYQYAQHGSGPHAVSSIATTPGENGGCALVSCKIDGIGNPNFYYDADGNMQCITTATQCDVSAARSYAWTSFDMAQSIHAGANATTLAYTPEHQRGSLTNSSGTLYYFSNPAAGVANELAPDGVTWRTYVAPYGHIVAEFFGPSDTISKSYYFAGDHLQSTTALTDSTGARDEYDSYDAWGARRYANGADAPTGCSSLHPSSLTLRGFTGQEEMDTLCLVNLNARYGFERRRGETPLPLDVGNAFTTMPLLKASTTG
jgi:hypothetical protein